MKRSNLTQILQFQFSHLSVQISVCRSLDVLCFMCEAVFSHEAMEKYLSHRDPFK